jgi:hypothetical protein
MVHIIAYLTPESINRLVVTGSRLVGNWALALPGCGLTIGTMLTGFAGSGLLGLIAATSKICADAVVAASKMGRATAWAKRIMFINRSARSIESSSHMREVVPQPHL